MDTIWKTLLWPQFGAAIDMIENAVRVCPDDLWSDASRRPEWIERDVVGFWYLVYHTLFFLDLYLSETPEGFAPPAPFTLDELDPAGLLPECPYTKDQLQSYLEYGRGKCRATIAALTDEKAREHCGFARLDMSRGELLLYNMRHVQHHAGQLNLMLRQNTGTAPRWVTQAKGCI